MLYSLPKSLKFTFSQLKYLNGGTLNLRGYGLFAIFPNGLYSSFSFGLFNPIITLKKLGLTLLLREVEL